MAAKTPEQKAAEAAAKEAEKVAKLKVELAELGVTEFTGSETSEELGAKLKEAKAAAKEAGAANKGGPIDIVIMGTGGALAGSIFVRQFSEEAHGEGFKALADEFCTKQPKRAGKVLSYTQVPASRIAKVEVRYREKEDAELHIDKQDPDAKIVDKVKGFTDKNEAVAFAATKRNSTVVVSKGALKE